MRQCLPKMACGMVEVLKSPCSLGNESQNSLLICALPSQSHLASRPFPTVPQSPFQPSSCLCSCCSSNSEQLLIPLPSSLLLSASVCAFCVSRWILLLWLANSYAPLRGHLQQRPSVTSSCVYTEPVIHPSGVPLLME